MHSNGACTATARRAITAYRNVYKYVSGDLQYAGATGTAVGAVHVEVI
jgi:hypothetical protein